VVKRRQLDRDLAEELEFHLAMREEKLIEQGMPPREAHYAARRGFGNAVSLKERSRDQWSFPSLESLIQDVRFGLRQLRLNLGFTAVATLTLALGIGGTTAIFSVIECAVLDPLPYHDSHRLAVITTRNIKEDQPAQWAWVSSAEFLEYRKKSQVFDEVIGFAGDLAANAGIETGTAAPEISYGVRVTDNTFSVLGVPPLLGRAISRADCTAEAPPVTVIAFNYWRSKFGGDPRVIGRTVLYNHRPTTVIGVMPPRFAWGGAALWLPALPSQGQGTDTGAQYAVIGHLRPGVTMEQAAAEVAVLSKAFAAVYPKEHLKEATFGAESLIESVVQGFRTTLYLVLGAVGLLFLIACVNVANLLLARATSREKEFAVRASLGAGRLRLIRQLLIESLLIALGGALLGSVLAWNLLNLLLTIIPPWDMPPEAEVWMNGWVMAFTVVISVVSTLLFGLAPAVLAAKTDLLGAMKGSARGAGETRGHNRLRNLLVVSQVALSLVLLTGAGLLIRSFFALRRVNLGYNTHQLLSVALGLPEARYKTVEQRNRYYQEALRRSRAVPGVISAAICTWPPMWGVEVAKLEIPGKLGGEDWTAQVHLLSDRYFATMGIPMFKGRDISEQDIAHSQKLAVVNRAFARKYFGAEDPLGRPIKLTNQLLLATPNSVQPIAFEIVGVAEDTRDNGPASPVEPQVYVPFTISGFAYQWILARTGPDPAAMLKPVRSSISDIDRELPTGGGGLSNGPVEELVSSQYTEPRFAFSLLSAFGALGLVLISIGIHGVLSYSVSRRTQEIGLRMALGAQGPDVRRMVMTSGLRWLGIGIGIGVPVSIALARILQNRIWGIKSADPLTLLAVSLLLIAVGLAACYFPARRATKVDPMVALRCE
jgi:putative ABC transport system permease protein